MEAPACVIMMQKISMRQRERERQTGREPQKRARERQQRRTTDAGDGRRWDAAAVILIVAGNLADGRTDRKGTAFRRRLEKRCRNRQQKHCQMSGAKTTSENDDRGSLHKMRNRFPGKIEQDAEETVASTQTSSMPFAAGYDAQETDSTTYLGSDSVQSSYALLVDLDDNTIVSQKSAYDQDQSGVHDEDSDSSGSGRACDRS